MASSVSLMELTVVVRKPWSLNSSVIISNRQGKGNPLAGNLNVM